MPPGDAIAFMPLVGDYPAISESTIASFRQQAIALGLLSYMSGPVNSTQRGDVRKSLSADVRVPTAYGQQANHSFIRSTMRKTIAAVESQRDGGSAGIGAVGVTEMLGGIRGVFEEGCGVGGVVSGEAALHDARIIIDMDRVSQTEEECCG